jgi:replication-associated recombination protein RarA
MELAMSGYFTHAVNRLRVIAQEDVGPADPQAVIFASLVLDQADAWRSAKNSAWRMAVANACFALATASKSRVGDLLQAASLHVVLDGTMPSVPDEALDKHTRRGRRKGRGLDHFLEHGAKLVGPRPLEEYEKRCEPNAVAFWKSKGDRRLGALEQRRKAQNVDAGADGQDLTQDDAA